MFYTTHRSGGSSIFVRLMMGSALSALAIGAAHAQVAAATNTPETVVVTGTSIRGAAPVGADLTTVGRDQIEDTKAPTIQTLLADIPELGNFGSAAIGNQNSDRGGGFSPLIHNIGAGSSVATLTLINGHRIPTTGLTESNSDPTIVASSALERVEILPDGASATYGSDAVVGVVNFITRKNFHGMELNAQSGIADHYNTFNGSALFGTGWESGSVMVAFDYSSRSELMNKNRDFITARQDIRRGAADPSLFTGIAGTSAATLTTTPAAGPGTTSPYGVAVPYPSTGQNFQTFACPVASIAPNSSSANAFYYQPGGGYGGPSYSTSTSNTPGNGACDNLSYVSQLPSETKNNVFVQVTQDITSNISLQSIFSYGARVSTQQLARGTLQATAYGPGYTGTNGSINPFYVGNATTGNVSELVRYDFDSLLGPGAYDKVNVDNKFTQQDLTWDMGNGREITISGVAGDNVNMEHQVGVVGATGGQPLSSGVGQALLALNGTTSTNGIPGNSIPDALALGTNYLGTRALTTLNSIDVWDPAGPTNRTSPTVIRSLKDSGAEQFSNQTIQDLTAKFDGPVFDLPAGSLKIAVGTEYLHQTMEEGGTTATSAGTATAASQSFDFRTGRTVYSGYAEIQAPLISEDMGVPLVQKLDLDIAGRYDHYSDFGDTQNPKISMDWFIIDGLKARASFGTSFVAPGIHDALGTNSQSVIVAGATPATPLNVVPFVGANSFNGGAGTAGTWVAAPTTCAAGGGTVINTAGQTVAAANYATQAYACKVQFGAANGAGTSAAFQIAGGHLGLQPATGRSVNVGFDIDGGKLFGLNGFSANVTYWEFSYLGLITGGAAVHPSLTYFAPVGGWNINSPYIQGFLQNRSLSISDPGTIWATTDNRLNNSFDEWFNGIDFNVNYFYRTDDAGTFHVGIAGTETLRESQAPHIIAGVTETIPGTYAPGPVDVKNGKNSPRYTTAAPELQFRATTGWQGDALGVILGFNFIHPQEISDTSFPYSLPGPGRGWINSAGVWTSAGTAHVGALAVFDLLFNYDLPQGFMGVSDQITQGTQLSLKIDNVLDTDPPFNPNTSNGYTIGNPIGRMFTIGIRKKL